MITPTPQNPPVADVRERLLRAADDVCSREGIYDARIEDFTRAAGIAKGTFYLYFSSKEAIVHAITSSAFAELGERCRAAAQQAGRGRGGRARALVDAHLEFYREHPGRMRVLHQARGILKFARPEWSPLAQALERHLDLVAELLALPAALSVEDRLDAARLLFGAAAGVASTWAAVDGGSLARLPRELAAPLARVVVDYAQAQPRPALAAEHR